MAQKLQNTMEAKHNEHSGEDAAATERLVKAIIYATEDVFKSMLLIKLKSGEPIERPINTKDGFSSEVCALISFVGDASGVLMFKCSKKVGAKLAERMLGMPVAEESDELRDAIGELLNIIIGSAKSYFSQENSFKLSIPTTVIGRDFSLYIKANTGDSAFFVPLTSGNAHMGLELYKK